MSDARNSSGNIRGGGAKQTGGAGRTARGANGGSKSNATLAGLEKGGIDRNAETKRYLQLKMMSKKLALSVRESLLSAGLVGASGDANEGSSSWQHTESEFASHNIPLPDPETAMIKLKAMREFTEDWYDEDFRNQWLERVHAVWEAELRAEFEAAKRAQHAAACQQQAMTTEELEAAIQNPDTPAEERKRLKKKLKARKQKAKKKNQENTC